MRIIWKQRKLAQAIFIGAAAFLISTAYSQLVLAVAPISQSYISDSPIAMGSLVSVSEGSAIKVVPSSVHNAQDIIGVAINADSSPLSLTSGSAKSVEVATSGIYSVLVSDINGNVQKGDYITASSINGIGMRATSNARVIGVAQTNLEAPRQEKYNGPDGQEKTVTLGEVQVLINVSSYFKEPEKTLIPQALQQVVNSIAGKEVSALPIVISLVIFVITLAVVSIIIYSMVRNSIISVGRNPMAQSAVYRNVIQLSGLVIGIMGVASFAIYFILTRL